MSSPIPPGSEVITVDGVEYLQWKVVLRLVRDWNPESGVLIAVAPPGGIGNLPAIAQGEIGFSPSFRNVELTELAHNDPTEASATWTLVTPGTNETPPVYDLELTIHRGSPGTADSLDLLDAADLDDGGSPTPGYIFQVNPEGNGVDLVAMRVGNTYWPTAVNTLSNATGANALAQVTIPAHPFKVRYHVQGQVVVDPDGPDVEVDLIARLGGTGSSETGATDGHVIARGFGNAGGATQTVVFSAAPPINSATGFGEVPAGSSRVVYIRVEQQGSGTDTFATKAGRALFSVTVDPIG